MGRSDGRRLLGGNRANMQIDQHDMASPDRNPRLGFMADVLTRQAILVGSFDME